MSRRRQALEKVDEIRKIHERNEWADQAADQLIKRLGEQINLDTKVLVVEVGKNSESAENDLRLRAFERALGIASDSLAINCHSSNTTQDVKMTVRDLESILSAAQSEA